MFVFFLPKKCLCENKLQEVLRVEQLLLQIEQQELKRQRENLIMRKNLARRELDEGVKMLMTNNFPPTSSSLQDLNNDPSINSNPMTNGSINSYDINSNNCNNSVSYRHLHNNSHSHQHNHLNEYRKSMPNLQMDFNASWNPNGNHNNNINSNGSEMDYQNQSAVFETQQSIYCYNNMDEPTSSRSEMHLHAPQPYQPPSQQHIHRSSMSNVNNNNSNNNNVYSNMTRHALMEISAVPKPKLTNDWVQYRKSEPVKPSLNSHWLIQEAEQRRIEQLNNVRTNAGSCSNKKPLPESIIQTITQRVVDLGIGTNVNKR